MIQPVLSPSMTVIACMGFTVRTHFISKKSSQNNSVIRNVVLIIKALPLFTNKKCHSWRYCSPALRVLFLTSIQLYSTHLQEFNLHLSVVFVSCLVVVCHPALFHWNMSLPWRCSDSHSVWWTVCH